jgi:hypothetical protein
MASWRFRFSSARRAALEALACAASAKQRVARIHHIAGAQRQRRRLR